MTEKLLATDHPLTAEQRRRLPALLDTLMPASDDGRMPSAAELDLVGYLQEKAQDFLPRLGPLLDSFDDAFAEQSLSARYAVVKSFSETQAALFQDLLRYTYACYYEDDRVLVGIGLAAGPPFPRGNEVEAGDLSLLDPVLKNSKTYRQP